MSNSSRPGKSMDISDLISRKKRETSVNVSLTKNQGLRNKVTIKNPGFNTGFSDLYSKRGLNFYNISALNITATILNGGTIGSIRVIGYTLNSLTPANIAAFKLAFATQYGINPNLINLSFSRGSLIIDFIAVSNIDSSDLTISDKSFFSNVDSVLKSIQPDDIADFIVSANISSSDLSLTGTASIDTAYTTINDTVDIVKFCDNDSSYNAKKIRINNPIVADTINDCIYTIYNTDVIRINISGTADKIATFPNDSGCRAIFINANSTYLIIPSNLEDTTMPGAQSPDPRPNKVYLINISTGAINTIILAESNINTQYGFDKLTRKFYYGSYMAINRGKMAYVTIPSDYSSATLSPTYSSLDFTAGAKLEFIDSNTAYTSNGTAIILYNISNQTSTIIAGYSGSGGGWSNAQGWANAPEYGPFLNANNGTNAFFSLVSDISYDSANQRILVADYGAHRIRSIDLRPGNNYAVTTLAGTSPVTMGLAVNKYGSTVSQGVLDTLGQVGLWGRGNMPAYTQITGPYLTSTIKEPYNITLFNNKIYVLTNSEDGTIQLSNGYLSNFTVVKDF
jgi:hypothetical protein